MLHVLGSIFLYGYDKTNKKVAILFCHGGSGGDERPLETRRDKSYVRYWISI